MLKFVFQGDDNVRSKAYEDEEEKEKQDILQKLDEKSQQSLRNKRSFFVRMVSDPKIYNPKIVEGIVKMKSFDKTVVGPFSGMYEETPNNQTA